MTKHLSLYTALLMVLLCQPCLANPISEARAMDIAAQFLVPGNAMQMVFKAKRSQAKAARLPKGTAATPPYYVISRGFDKGFVIVSGDDCMPEVLGYTDSGNYDESNMPESFRTWMQYRADIIEEAQVNGCNTPRNKSTERNARRASNRTQDVEPLIKTLWHQNSPYNDKCPIIKGNGARAITGCTATAASQIVYYWHREANNSLAYSTPTYTFGDAPCTEEFQIMAGTPIKYDLMLSEYHNEPREFKDAVATFVAALGMSIWQTYGSSTSGQIGDCVNAFSNQFGLKGGTCVYKGNGYNEESWAQLLYEELTNGRPLLYCGCDASGSGHAVVCDGYQASNGFFHINFGWGGGYNGYFSVEDGVKGWGFNASSQGCVFGVCPKRPNLDVSISLPSHVFRNVDNEFRIKVTNNGTLPFSGLYLFANETGAKPTSLASAKSKDESTVVGRDNCETITLTAQPATNKPLFIYVTDKDLNVIATKEVTVESADAELRISEIKALTTSEDSIAGGIRFGKVYNSNAYINVTVENSGQTMWTGTARLELHESSDGGKTWTFAKNLTKKDEVLAGKSTVMSFLATSLSSSKLYKAMLNRSWGMNSSADYVEFKESATDTVACLCSMGNDDLKAEMVGDCLTFSGHWDVYRYNYYCTLAKNKAAKSVDITACMSIGEMPAVNYPYPNMLIYAPENVSGKNVISPDGICQDLSITAGYDFLPRKEFVAWAASINLNQEPNRWYMLCVPFDCSVPYGVIAREVTTKHSTTSLALFNKTTNVTLLEAGKTYLVMTSSDTKGLVNDSGCKSINVLAAPASNVTDDAFVGTFKATVTPPGAKIINGYGTTDTQKFAIAEEGTPVDGLRGYFLDAKMNTSKTDFNVASNSTIDPSYQQLGLTIQSMYDVYRDFSGIVQSYANAAMLDSISNAERIYTEQSLGATATKKYYTDLQSFNEQYKMMISDAGNTEVDFTSLIENPSFEASSTTLSGWTADEGQWSLPSGRNPNKYFSAGLDGERVFYSCQDDYSGVGISQTIGGLKPGYYRLTAMVGTDVSNTVTVFAGDSTIAVSGHPFGNLYLTKVTLDNVCVEKAEELESGSLTIGVKAGDWYKADDFRLTYIGALKDNEGTGVTAPTATRRTSDAIYNLQGLRVSTPVSGHIYIKGGKAIRMK